MRSLLLTFLVTSLFLCGFSANSFSQTSPANDFDGVDWTNPPVTPSNQNYFINQTVAGFPQTTIDAFGTTAFVVGDTLGVFIERNDSLVCVGKREATAAAFSIQVYIDDAGTAVQDGGIIGQPVEYVLWKQVSTGITYYLDFTFYTGAPIPAINVADITDVFNQAPPAGDKLFASITALDCAGNDTEPFFELDQCGDCKDPADATFGLDCVGCTDMNACNFDPNAEIIDNDACILVDGGTVSTTSPLTVCSGDGAMDIVSVVGAGQTGPNYTYIITDGTATTILGENVDGDFDLEGAPAGTCLIWGYSSELPYVMPASGLVADIAGCGALSANSIAVVREQAGCMDASACNFDAAAQCDDGSCILLDAGTISSADVLTTCSGDGVDDNITATVAGNVGPNYAFVITDGTGTTILGGPNAGTFNLEGAPAGTCLIWGVAFDDIMIPESNLVADITGCFVLSNSIGVTRETYGCSDPTACNYDAAATCGDNATACEGTVPNCGTPGCLDPCAPNYDASVDYDDGSCADYDTTCDTDVCTNGGTTVWDAASCSCVAETTTVSGCMDDTACNYNPDANCDDSSCDFGDVGCPDPCNAIVGCTDPTANNYDDSANCDSGSCTFNSGCIDPTACNYDDTAVIDDNSCIFTIDCEGTCGGDATEGCTDATACNYDADADCDDSSCILPDGCTDPTACNYDDTAACDDGSCVAAATWYEDLDGDGFGDIAVTIEACTQPGGFAAQAGELCPGVDDNLLGGVCPDNPSLILSPITCTCISPNDNCELDIENGTIGRHGALFGITSFPVNGNEVYSWYNSNNQLLAQFVNNFYFSPEVAGTYYLVVTDPDYPDCTQFFDARTITEANGCCELEGSPE